METLEEKRMRESKIETAILDVGADLSAKDVTCEEIFEYIEDIQKFKKWFNFYPVVYLKSDESRLKVGTVMEMYGGFGPAYFEFTLTIVELRKNYLKAVVGGKFYGVVEMYTEKRGDIVHFQKNFRVCADNQKDLDDYAVGASKFHGKYVKWRVNCLRKLIRKDRKRARA